MLRKYKTQAYENPSLHCRKGHFMGMGAGGFEPRMRTQEDLQSVHIPLFASCELFRKNIRYINRNIITHAIAVRLHLITTDLPHN